MNRKGKSSFTSQLLGILQAIPIGVKLIYGDQDRRYTVIIH